MQATADDIRAFIIKLENSRSNLVDEIITEADVLTGISDRKKDTTTLNKLLAEIADVQLALAAFEDERLKR